MPIGTLEWWTKLVTFGHVALAATWFGGTLLLCLLLSDALATHEPKRALAVLQRVHRWNLRLYLPTSLLVLATGLFLWYPWLGSAKPLWLLIKERFGSLFILGAIAAIAWLGRKWLDRAVANPGSASMWLRRYRGLLSIFLLGILVLMYAGVMRPL